MMFLVEYLRWTKIVMQLHWRHNGLRLYVDSMMKLRCNMFATL